MKQAFGALTAVHVANALVNASLPGSGGCSELNLEHLREIGLEHRLETWRALVPDLPTD